MKNFSYTAVIDFNCPDDTAVSGCGCKSDGTFTIEDVNDIQSCSLTPGDPSPAGRCPACDTLVYITVKETKNIPDHSEN